MFVPLPVPFVFQRTASDFAAWRIKSPLALRSSSVHASTPRPPAPTSSMQLAGPSIEPLPQGGVEPKPGSALRSERRGVSCQAWWPGIYGSTEPRYFIRSFPRPFIVVQ
ncbi:hypothetical protein DPEC_G00201010 [Dallia pectoralis]|uniref:Uncharacterized protein n=1 Tax=Dallia pectoralis TaxID=75939 RepID=A0ACC2G9C1_DALPE|nr:hypothetical protein DPEC_G00201010 [Dallia pectoralis]